VESRAKLVTQLRHSLTHDMGKAVAFLEGAATALAAYAEMAPPPSFTPQPRTATTDAVPPQSSTAPARASDSVAIAKSETSAKVGGLKS